ncbi:MAG TPA: rhomboid family intramembrane serine protease [Gaiellaceae bacterium]|jgi:membrane associated rhomboid family serine protease|nr:rhomboid family intramembrane serine protease [Gaiellaceae bacterium]
MAAPEQTQTMVCYRHPSNETAITCSNCGRPICTECMVFAPVGIKCPECAGLPTGAKKAAVKARSYTSVGTDFIVTKVLIGLNVLVFLAQVVQSGSFTQPFSDIFFRGALAAPPIAQADQWYRLVTCAFLHGSVLHIFFNMLMLWWFGRPLEQLLGRGRFLAIYVISILAGSAGALLINPTTFTVGASGAVFGILGAGLVLERKNINVFGGSALIIVILNLALSFTLNSVSIGGHVGGLVGGALCILVLSGFGRGHAVYSRFNFVAAAGLLAVAVASLLVAYFQVRGYA